MCVRGGWGWGAESGKMTHTGLQKDRFQCYCAAFLTGECHTRLLAGRNCNVWEAYEMATCSVTEGWSHDEGRGGRIVTGVQREHETKV